MVDYTEVDERHVLEYTHRGVRILQYGLPAPTRADIVPRVKLQHVTSLGATFKYFEEGLVYEEVIRY